MEAVLGWIATILFSVMMIPQIEKTIRTRVVDGVSIWLFVISCIANVIALWYACLIAQPPLIFKYITALILSVFYIILYIKYRKYKYGI